MPDVFNDNRYYEDEALEEAERIKKYVGKNASSEDYSIAEMLAEDDQITEARDWFKSLNKGELKIEPPKGDKRVMVYYNAPDEETFELFTNAAYRATKKYGGFFQVGAGEKKGYAAFELWTIKGTPPEKVVGEIYKEMKSTWDLYNKLK